MKTCKRCKVTVRDNSSICPLCRAVLADSGSNASAGTYPHIAVGPHKYDMIKRIFLFISIISAVGSVVTNYLTYNGIMWSAITIAAIIYFWIIMTYSIKRNINIASQILLQLLCISVITVIMDNSVGYTGWSVNHVIPEIIILANISLLIIIFINRMYWHTYVLYQIVMAVTGLIPGVLFICGMIKELLPTVVATITSFLVLLITIIFADKSIKGELKRRFHF